MSDDKVDEPLNPEFWDSRWRAGDTAWDLGQAAPPLVHAMDALPRKRALVVGCGRGHEVVELAKRGFDVIGVDFAPGAIAAASELARTSNVDAKFLQADVFTLPGPLAPVQLWVEHTCFCAIDPTRRSAYVDVAARTIAHGGLLLGLFYAHKKPGGPPFSTTRAEVEKLFSPQFEIEKLELATDSHPRRAGEELLGMLRRR